MHRIYISLVNSNSPVGKMVAKVTKDKVTHAAIALDYRLESQYSFSRKWDWFPFVGCFKKEDFSQGYYRKIETMWGVIIQIEVTEEQYRNVESILQQFISQRDDYHYSLLKLFANLINKEVIDERGFICSEFVAFVLSEAGICEFNQPLHLVRPQVLYDIFENQVVYDGDVKVYEGAGAPSAYSA